MSEEVSKLIVQLTPQQCVQFARFCARYADDPWIGPAKAQSNTLDWLSVAMERAERCAVLETRIEKAIRATQVAANNTAGWAILCANNSDEAAAEQLAELRRIVAEGRGT